MKKLLYITVVFVSVFIYLGSYLTLRANDKLFFYKEVEYFRGIGGPEVNYSIASRTSYLHYLYYLPALIEKPFSWESARLSVAEGGEPIHHLGYARLSTIWYFFVFFLIGVYVYKKHYKKRKSASNPFIKTHTG